MGLGLSIAFTLSLCDNSLFSHEYVVVPLGLAVAVRGFAFFAFLLEFV
jgi:hypothetical protein